MIGHVDLISTLFAAVYVPTAVRDELSRDEAPSEVRSWIADPPAWLAVAEASLLPVDPILLRLDPAERAAITLATHLRVDTILKRKIAPRSQGWVTLGPFGTLFAAL